MSQSRASARRFWNAPMRKGASCGLELWEGCLLWNLLQEWMRIDGSPVLLCAEWKHGRRLLQAQSCTCCRTSPPWALNLSAIEMKRVCMPAGPEVLGAFGADEFIISIMTSNAQHRAGLGAADATQCALGDRHGQEFQCMSREQGVWA